MTDSNDTSLDTSLDTTPETAAETSAETAVKVSEATAAPGTATTAAFHECIEVDPATLMIGDNVRATALLDRPGDIAEVVVGFLQRAPGQPLGSGLA